MRRLAATVKQFSRRPTPVLCPLAERDTEIGLVEKYVLPRLHRMRRLQSNAHPLFPSRSLRLSHAPMSNP